MTQTEEAKKALFDLRSKGGKAISKKRGRKGMSELGKKGAAVRWPKKESTE